MSLTLKETLKLASTTNTKIDVLSKAIAHKISTLKETIAANESAKNKNSFFRFFSNIGAASTDDMQAKVKALEGLKHRVDEGKRDSKQFAIFYRDNVLDGNTLTLFKLASKHNLGAFDSHEKENLKNRSPLMRIFRSR